MTSVDQKLAAVRRLLAEQPALFLVQGVVVATYRTVGDRRLGPYYALRYRDARRQRSLYLGPSAELAAQVRALVDRHRRPYREQVALARCRDAVRAAYREHKRQWRRELEQVGLTLKGHEIRGWKQLSTRRLKAQAGDIALNMRKQR